MNYKIIPNMCIILLLKTNVKIYTGPFYGLNILRDDTGHVTFSDDEFLSS